MHPLQRICWQPDLGHRSKFTESSLPLSQIWQRGSSLSASTGWGEPIATLGRFWPNRSFANALTSSALLEVAAMSSPRTLSKIIFTGPYIDINKSLKRTYHLIFVLRCFISSWNEHFKMVAIRKDQGQRFTSGWSKGVYSVQLYWLPWRSKRRIGRLNARAAPWRVRSLAHLLSSAALAAGTLLSSRYSFKSWVTSKFLCL